VLSLGQGVVDVEEGRGRGHRAAGELAGVVGIEAIGGAGGFQRFDEGVEVSGP